MFFKLKNKYKTEKLLVLITFFTTAFFIYIGCRNYRYYGLPLNVFSVFFLVLIFNGDLKLKNQKLFIRLSSALVSVSILVAMSVGTHFVFIFQNKKSLPQYQFAQQIKNGDVENPTLLNYGFLDGGFYLSANIVPQNKYFCTLNNQLDEMEKEHQKILTDGLVDYVVIRIDKITPEQFENEYPKYKKIATATQKNLFIKPYRYILYKLK